MKIILRLSIIALMVNFGSLNAQVSTLNPMIYFSFNDSSAADISSNAFSSSVAGTPTFSSGISGTALKLNGSGDHISLGKDSMFDFGNDRSLSISFWYRVPSNDSANATSGFRIRPIISKMNGASATTDFINFIEDKYDGDGAFFKWGTGNSSDRVAWMITPEPSKNTWHHIVTTLGVKKYGGVKYFIKKIFIDCKLVEHDSSTVKASKQNVNLYIGRGFDDNTAKAYYFKGELDELLVFDRELTDSESLWLCNKKNYSVSTPVPRNYSSLKGTVKNAAGDPLDSSKVYLCKINWSDSSINITNTSNTSLTGYYEFLNIPNDSTYFLAADPDTNAHHGELTTLYDKTLLISSAQEIQMHNQDSVINFQTLNLFDPSGNYSVNGNIFSCQACKKSGSGNPIKDLNVIITDEFGRRIANVKTDAMGNFKVNRLINGTYYFFVNRPGAKNSNAPSVTINNGNVKLLSMSFNGEALKIDQLTAIEDGSFSTDQKITVYSNSTNNLNISNKFSERLNYSIIEMSGKKLSSSSVNGNAIQTIELNAGMYILIGTYPSGKTISQKFLVK